MAVKWIVSNGAQGATSDLITAMDWIISAKQAGVNVRVVNDWRPGPARHFPRRSQMKLTHWAPMTFSL